MDSSDDSNRGFIKHVFNFDDDSKGDILNIIQYSLIAIIPVIILNKLMSKYVPEADDKKGSLEITAEIIIQIIVMFLGLLLINRIVIYIPTYSGLKYPDFRVVYVILAILMITLSLQTKLGEKVSILVDRISELWEGKSNNKNGKNGKNATVKVSQPIAGQITGQPIMNSPTNQSLYTDGTAISSLPTNDTYNNTVQSAPTQQSPNFNSMYQHDFTPLVGAATPGQSDAAVEPMAANSVLGGGFGSSW